MKNIILLCFLILLYSFSFAKTQKEEYQNDYLYSAEYFDYLIECAQEENNELIKQKNKDSETVKDSVIYQQDDAITADFTPFKLKIEENIKTSIYKDSLEKADSKVVIPLTKRFFITDEISKTRNKYNSNDYKIQTGVEYHFKSPFILTGGIETNLRGLDQNPSSRKIYFSPAIQLGNMVSLKFHNKLNILDYSSDHDIGLKLSPFKAKNIDFGVYSGVTRKQNGTNSESINFSTNFYF